MNESRFASIGEAISDESFPEVDLALRRGRHIDRDDGSWYALLADGQSLFEDFYRRFDCELVHKSDGYFFLLPTGDRLGRRQLSVAEMLVGQALALLLLEPSTVERGGVIPREDVLAQLVTVMGAEALTRALNPKKRRRDERVAEETVRSKVAEAIRRLVQLGFVESIDQERLRLRSALMRFAEPVRQADGGGEALRELVALGEVALGSGERDASNSAASGEEDSAFEALVSADTGDDASQEELAKGTGDDAWDDVFAVEADGQDEEARPAEADPASKSEPLPAQAAGPGAGFPEASLADTGSACQQRAKEEPEPGS